MLTRSTASGEEGEAGWMELACKPVSASYPETEGKSLPLRNLVFSFTKEGGQEDLFCKGETDMNLYLILFAERTLSVRLGNTQHSTGIAS